MAEANDQAEHVVNCGCARCVIARAEPRRSSSVTLVVCLIAVVLIMLYLAWPVFDDLGMLH